LTERENASLLTTGRTSASGASADAVGLITADLLGGVGHAFGLDAVRLESGEEEEFFSDPLLVASEEDPHSRLTLTKRLSSDLEVTLSQAVAEGGGRTTIVSYRPWRGVLARATQRDDFTYAFELRHDLTLGEKRRQPPPPPRRPERAAAQVGSVVLRAEGGPAESALRARLELVEGQRFDHRRWLLDRDRLQEALAQAGFFEARVFATREPRAGAAAPPDTKLTLSYRVLSGPRTALVFEGHEAPAELREQIERAWWHSEFDASIESEAARLTRASLLDQGHTEARVKAVTTSGGRGSEAWKRLVVRVEAGRRARALEVVFTGAERVPVERLRALVKSDEARRAAFRDSDALLRSALALARGEGLLAAKAEARASLRGEDGVLEVTLVEGPQFTVGPVSVTGAAVVSETSLREAAQLEPGAVYREADVAAARERLRKLLFARGFALAGVKLEGSIDAAKASVGISIAVSTGSRQVLQEVVVDGEVAAGARRLAEKSGLRVGEPVVADEWARARRRLFDTGMFRRVELEAEPIGAEPAAGEDQPVRARFKLEDWPGLRLRYGLQLAGERDPLAEDEPQKFKLGGIAEATRQTMFGLPIGSSLSGQAREGFLLGRGALSLPRAFGQPLRSSVFLSRERVDRPVAVLSERYTLVEDTTELTFEERVRAGRILELAASYGWTWTRLHGELAFVPVDADARIGRLRATALLDGRDVLVDPRRGYFHSTSYERGGGPGFDPEERLSFSRAFVQQFLYLPIPLGSVSASGLRWERTRGRDLLSGGRLSLGGASTVRGYPEDVAEGLVSGSPDVVENALVLNQELRFPLKGLLFGGLFVDHASLWREGEGKVLSRTGIGMGVRFRTPVGVIRLDFGYPLSGQDKKLRFYLALGQAF
jgi:outer membrane protein assembly factor BamA